MIYSDNVMKQPRPKLLSESLTQQTTKPEGFQLSAFIKRMRTICFGGDDRGLSYGSYKQVIAIKSLITYINNKPQDPHSFKE